MSLIISALLILFIIGHLCVTHDRLLRHPMRSGLWIMGIIALIYLIVYIMISFQPIISWLDKKLITLTICTLFILSIDVLWIYFQKTLNTFRNRYKRFYNNKRRKGIPIKKFRVRGLSLIGQSGLPYASILIVILPAFIDFSDNIPNGQFYIFILLMVTGMYVLFLAFLVLIITSLEKAQLNLEKHRLYNNAILKMVLEHMLNKK